MMGRVRAALKLLSVSSQTSLLSLYEIIDNTTRKTVGDVREDKHPDPQPAHPEALIMMRNSIQLSSKASQVNQLGLLLFVHKVLLDPLDLMPSAGEDCVLPLAKSQMICAAVARRIFTTYIDPSILEAYTSCCLIPLDKRLIEVARRSRAKNHWKGSHENCEV